MFARCLLKEIMEEFPDLLTLNMVDEIHIKSGYFFSRVYSADIWEKCFFSDDDQENSYLFEGDYVNINKRDFLLREINDYSFILRQYRRNKKFADSIVLNDDFVDKKENGDRNKIFLLAVSVNDDLVYKNGRGFVRIQNDDGDVYCLGYVARYEFNFDFLSKENINVFCGCCNERAEELANLLSNPCNIYKHLHRHFPEFFSRESIEEISVSLYYTMYMNGSSVAFIRNDKKEAYLLKGEKLIYDDHMTVLKYMRQEGFFGKEFHLYNANDINRNKWTSKDSFVQKIRNFIRRKQQENILLDE